MPGLVDTFVCDGHLPGQPHGTQTKPKPPTRPPQPAQQRDRVHLRRRGQRGVSGLGRPAGPQPPPRAGRHRPRRRFDRRGGVRRRPGRLPQLPHPAGRSSADRCGRRVATPADHVDAKRGAQQPPPARARAAPRRRPGSDRGDAGGSGRRRRADRGGEIGSACTAACRRWRRCSGRWSRCACSTTFPATTSRRPSGSPPGMSRCCSIAPR